MTENTIYALGFFDGVHRGHKALLDACRSLADANGCKAAAITFSAHPDTLVLGKTPPMINTTHDRVRLMKEAGMDHVVILPFDKKMQTMPWEDFLTFLGETYHARGLVCGHDFRFGNRGHGNADLLQSYCRENAMACRVVDEQVLGGVTISSTHIRTLLETGNVAEANRFLGHPHILTGTVTTGRKLGRTLGIPTANIRLPEETVRLPLGVYACKAWVDGKPYLAVTNIGSRPTVGGHETRAESWLLDFDADLYGQPLTLGFYKFLRAEKKFDSLDALREEIMKNAGETRDFFENNTK